MEEQQEKNRQSEHGTVVEETAVEDSNIIEYEQSLYHGPIPHPAILEGYENVLKGAADRILKMAEEQGAHRRDMESKIVASNISNEKRGMHFAFAITIVFILLSGFLIYYDKTIAGYLTLGTVVIGHAYNYLSQKRKEEELLAEPKKNADERLN